jgi:hypothetical protein
MIAPWNAPIAKITGNKRYNQGDVANRIKKAIYPSIHNTRDSVEVAHLSKLFQSGRFLANLGSK